MTTPPPPQDDPIDVVMHQTGCSRDEAEQAMALHPADVVSAIMFVTPALGASSARISSNGPSVWLGTPQQIATGDAWKECARQARDTIDAIETHVKKNSCTYYQAGEALGVPDSVLWQLAVRDQMENLFSDMRDAKKSGERNHGQ